MNRQGFGRRPGAMPKRILIALALSTLGLAACYNNGSNYNAPANPTPTPIGTYSPNPGITSTTVSVTVSGTPKPGQAVSESLMGADGRPSGAPIATATTNPQGQVTFSSLTPSQAYCWTATFTPTFTSQVCTLFWQRGISLGT